MFKTVIVPLEWLATFLAIASPIIIIHWLCAAVNSPVVMPFVEFLEPFINPFNATLKTMLEPIPSFTIPWMTIKTNPLMFVPSNTIFSFTKPIQVMNHSISPVQGVLGILLTVMFFVMNVVIQILKAGDKKMEINANTRRMNKALKEARLQKVAQDKKVTTSKDVVVYVEYSFLDCPTGATYFETGYSRYNGRSLQSNPDCLVVQFDTADQALNFAKDTAGQVFQYYQTLRPSDLQPPFRICVAAFRHGTPNPERFEFCRTMKNYAKDNQVILTHETWQILEAMNQLGLFNIQTLGYYNVYGKNQELHHLAG